MRAWRSCLSAFFSLTTTGTSARPARRAARRRRSPATSSYAPSPTLWTMSGWMMPFSRMEAASSARARSSNVTRGWRGFGRMLSTGTWRGRPDSSTGVCSWAAACSGAGSDGEVGGRCGSSAESPLPRALRRSAFMLQNLLRELNVGFGPTGPNVIGNHGFSEAGRLREPDASWNHGPKDVVAEEFAEVLSHLAHEDGAVVVHGEQNAFDAEVRAEGSFDA